MGANFRHGRFWRGPSSPATLVTAALALPLIVSTTNASTQPSEPIKELAISRAAQIREQLLRLPLEEGSMKPKAQVAQWYNWGNWCNWCGQVPRRVGGWRWPGR